jgi:hypothetical protein
VLLIVVTVGIGALVVGIIRGYVTENKQVIEKTATDVQCSVQVQIVVPTYKDAYMICNKTDAPNSTVNFTLENTGSMAIDDLQVKIFGSNGMVDVNSVMPTGLAPGKVNASLSVTYNTVTIGTLEEVRIIPTKKVTAQTNQIFCNEAALKFATTDISSCP